VHFLLLLVLGLVLWPILHSVGRLTHQTVICRNCGTSARSVTVSPRQLLIELLLWFSGLIPGVIYTLWCNHVMYEACAKCKSRDIVPVDSPVGRKLAADTLTDVTPMSESLGRK